MHSNAWLVQQLAHSAQALLPTQPLTVRLVQVAIFSTMVVAMPTATLFTAITKPLTGLVSRAALPACTALAQQRLAHPATIQVQLYTL